MFESQDNRMSSTTLIRFARPESTEDRQASYTLRPTGRPAAPRSSSVTYRSDRRSQRIDRRRSRTFAEDPFRARFGRHLPSGMRQEARGMEWRTFVATYAPENIRVESLRSTRLTAGRRNYEFAVTGLTEGMSTTVSIMSMGAAGAMTQILADHGRRVEILEFHQYDIFEATVTFIYAQHKNTRVWAVGFGADRDTSIASALASAATRLHG
ncbi:MULTISPECIES: hypothetical protein [Corynebacterium]|uniref:2-isopropylmalate synthase LeuA allosteric (dimerisation) domain-containing protein n=1 Tax=Corynebacterium provencense TaxID=1737425 RepID=A0A2Z3YWU2_9CORY|nr:MULTISPECIES: hypothetical protein [Corynebacterium]AWT27024.1 hypothetical protein Csp1_22740 [Corynebacterium provencense]